MATKRVIQSPEISWHEELAIPSPAVATDTELYPTYMTHGMATLLHELELLVCNGCTEEGVGDAPSTEDPQ
jgi:hypothetical protein